MEKLGILAGAGKLPVECARAAANLGYEVYAVGLLPNSDTQIAQFAKDFQFISVAQLEAILNYLRNNQIQKVTMIGKVTKELLFNGAVVPDARMVQLIMSLPDRKDDTIMMAFVRELAKSGIQAFDQTALIRKLMPRRGTITKREPTEQERQDMEFGFRIAKELGRFDIGQTVVVKNRAVMALEAIEGTDACIERGSSGYRGGQNSFGRARKNDFLRRRPRNFNRCDVIAMKLPQCEIFDSTNAQEILFVTGGRAPRREFFLEISGGRKIFCVDKGIELCRACELIPNFLIGDFDSANNSAVEWAQEKNIPVEKYPADKDFTDTQLAMTRAAEIFGEHVAILTGCFGGRFDHLYSTIFTCATIDRKIFLADEREIIFYLRGGESVEVKFFKKPLAVSLLPITSTCEGVTTKNLHWELDDVTLTQNFPNATSNRADADKIFLSIKQGILAIYFCFDE